MIARVEAFDKATGLVVHVQHFYPPRKPFPILHAAFDAPQLPEGEYTWRFVDEHGEVVT